MVHTEAMISEANRHSRNQALGGGLAKNDARLVRFREGHSTLFPEESALLGERPAQRILHFRCGRGWDSLSISREFGAEVVGVDDCPEAIHLAQTLREESGVAATFHCADPLTWVESHGAERFEGIFAAYGVVPWISDLGRWASGIERCLGAGGRLVLVDFHPFLQVFGDDGAWAPTFDYMGGALIEELDGVPNVAVQGEPPSGGNEETDAAGSPAYSFAWGLGDLVTALTQVGMAVTHLKEYPYCNGWQPFPDMEVSPDGRARLPNALPRLPLMFSLVCQKGTD